MRARDARAASELTQIVRRLGDHLHDLATSVGLQHRQAWRLLDLREVLGSRELAARLLSSSGAGSAWCCASSARACTTRGRPSRRAGG